MYGDGVLKGNSSASESDLVRSLKSELDQKNRTLEMLLKSEEQFKTVFNSSYDGYFLSHNEKIVLVNPAGARMFGYESITDFLKKTPWEYSPKLQPDGQSSIDKGRYYLEKALAGEPQQFYWQHLFRDGSPLHVEISLSLVILDGIHYVLGCLRDVSERLVMERSLKESETRLRTIFEGCSDAITLYSEGAFREVNQAAVKLYGFANKEELIGLNPIAISPPVQPDGTESVAKIQQLAELLQDESVHRFEWRHQRPDGSQFDAEVVLSAIPYGESMGILSCVRDISDRIRYTKDLEHLSSVLNAIRSINQVINREREAHLLINKAAQILARIREFQHVWCILLNRENQPAYYVEFDPEGNSCELTEFSDESLSLNQILILRKKAPYLVAIPGESFFNRVTIPREREDLYSSMGSLEWEGHFFGFLSVSSSENRLKSEEEATLFRELCNDLAYALLNLQRLKEQQETFRRMEDAKKQAEEASRTKDEFLAMVTHELRTPLNPILGLANLLKEKAPEGDIEFLDVIISSGNRQLSLIERILEYSRLDQAAVTPSVVSFSLLEMMNGVFQRVEPSDNQLEYVFNNGHVSDFECIPESLEVVSDRDMVERVLENLLQNAFKYTDKGRICMDVAYRALSKSRVELFCSISDTGIGMTPEVQKIIFDAFAQADHSYKRQYGGLGLGLAICRKIVDVLGGEISVESEPGEGSCFQIKLPMEIKSNLETRERKRIEKERSLLRLSTPLDVLVVEDDPENCRLMEFYLKKLGCQCTIAEDGHKAVEIANTSPFDVILMDLNLPGIDGFEAAERIVNSSSLNQKTPTFAVSANVKEQAIERCEGVGIKGFISKPIKISDLQQTLEYIAQWKLARS